VVTYLKEPADENRKLCCVRTNGNMADSLDAKAGWYSSYIIKRPE